VMIDESISLLGEDYFCWLMKREPMVMMRRYWKYLKNKRKTKSSLPISSQI
jgi:hypothetical protein